MLLSNKDLYIQGDLSANFANLFCHKNIALALSTISKHWISFNIPEQFQTIVWVFGLCQLVMLTMKC